MYQSITIAGNLGSDAEMKYTPSGVPYTNLSIAVNESWTGADGQKHDETTWWRVTCWRKLAEITAQYCQKGKLVLVVGNKVKARHYVDKAGEVKDTLECTAETVRFLGSKGTADTVATGDGGMVDEDSIPF